MSLDYPELPKADSSTTNEASNFLTTPSGHPLQLTDNVEANSTTSTFSQPGNLTSVEPSSQSNHNLSSPTVPSVLPGNSSHNGAASFTDRMVPQVGVLPSQSSVTNMLSDIQVVPNANFSSVPSVNHNVVPNGILPANSAIMHPMNDASMTAPLQYPNMTTPMLYHNQDMSAVPQESMTPSGVYHQQDMAAPMSYPQQYMATPLSYPQQDMTIPMSDPQQYMATPLSYPQQDMTIPMSDPQQDMTTPGSYPQQNMAIAVPYSQQDMGSYPQHITVPVLNPQQHLSTPEMHPQQDTTTPLPYAQQDMTSLGSQPPPATHPSQNGVPMHVPQQVQFILPGTQVIPPSATPVVRQDQASTWGHNPRVAHGPLPTPPTYEDANLMPAHPPVQPPLPPPISVPLPENGLHSTGSVAHIPPPNTGHVPVSDPNNMVSKIPGHPVHHQQQNVPHFSNAGQSLQGTEPVLVSQVTHGPVNAHPQIVQPVNQTQSHYASQISKSHQSSHHPSLQTVVVQRDDKRHRQQQAERDAALEREQQAALARERQAALERERQAALERERQTALERERHAALERERQAALERERQERILLEKEKEEIRRRHEELEMIISRNSATEQQVMELRDLLQAREKSLAAKEFEQQAMMQQRQRLQEQKEKEITDIEQQLIAEKVALQQQQEQQQSDLIRERENIEQHKLAALKEVEKERERIFLQQKQLREQQQNMSEQMAQWLQTRNQNSSRQVQVETGLPVGWEKKFDQTTGRFYYQDHNTKTTHWNPPSSWLTHGNPAQPTSKQGVSNQSPQQVTANAVPQPSSLATGNVPKPTSGHLQPLASVSKTKLPPTQATTDHNPVVGPSAKPVANSGTVVVPDRSTKPQSQPSQTNRGGSNTLPVNQIPPHVWKRKMENLQPVHGGSMVGSFFQK